MKEKIVSVIGLGYIGLPTAALLASNGYKVVGMDINSEAVEKINQGRIHIVEPGLDKFVEAAVANGRLAAYTEAKPGDIYIICVPTPFKKEAYIPTPNIDYVIDAAQRIAPLVKDGDMVILESTSPVGTTNLVREELVKAGVALNSVSVAYCPERVLPGKIMTELVENDRIVGGCDSSSTARVAEFYRTFVSGEVIETDAKSAEMCKLTENSFRDVNIAFANELSVLCDREGIDVWTLIQLANRHPRVNVLQPGVGVGGHCIAVDPWFIVSRNPETARLIQMGRQVNDAKSDWVVKKIISEAERRGTRRVNCLGLAFKPDIDDLRESPALAIALELADRGFEIVAVEPNIEHHNLLNLIAFDEVLTTSGITAILVKHTVFTTLEAKNKLREIDALDFCGALSE